MVDQKVSADQASKVTAPAPDAVLFKTKATLLRLTAILDYERTLLGWVSTSYKVTPTLVQVREGIFRRREMDIPIRNIQDVSYKAGICGRLLGYGTLHIETAGRKPVKLYKIQRAKKMRNVILGQLATLPA